MVRLKNLWCPMLADNLCNKKLGYGLGSDIWSSESFKPFVKVVHKDYNKVVASLTSGHWSDKVDTYSMKPPHNGGRQLVEDPNVDMSHDDEPPMDNGNMDNDSALENNDNMEDDGGIDNDLNDKGGDSVCFQLQLGLPVVLHKLIISTVMILCK
uniref:Uncharacterized protein n=1 Tax=Romanomermis culicivorax TaxID=13658 RepID=A0A915HR70_ROMCU